MKKIIAAMMSIVMMLSFTACGDSEETSNSNIKKGSSSDLGCELSDYFYIDSKEKIDKFIENNELTYDEEMGDYFNKYITITLNEDGTSIEMATLVNPGNYTMFGISIGEEFDRDIVSARLKRNNLPLWSDEGNYIYYSEFGPDNMYYASSAIAVRLNEDNTVGFVIYSDSGLGAIAKFGEGDISEVDVVGIYKDFASGLNDPSTIFYGSFTDKAMTFIENHSDLFIGGDPDCNSLDYTGTEDFNYKKFIKSPENYPLNIMVETGMYVYEITETNLENGVCITEGIIGFDERSSSSGIDETYWFIMPGTVDVYAGDEVYVHALPLGYGAFENSAGDQVKCVYLAVTSMGTDFITDFDGFGYDY